MKKPNERGGGGGGTARLRRVDVPCPPRLTTNDEMSATHHAIIRVSLVLACAACAAFAQVASVAPKGHWSGVPIDLVRVTRVEVSHNSPDAIRQELLDTNTIGLIAASTGLAAKQLATLAVAPGPIVQELWFYQAEGSGEAGKLFGTKLQFFVQGRLDGHTKEFLLSALTNSSPAAQSADPDLRALLSQRPELPAHLLKRCGSGFYTNRAEEIFRTAKYCFADGEIAWCYDFCISRAGEAFGVSEWKVDAKEYDPKYRAIIVDIENAVRAEMQQKGTWGRFGSIHEFSLRKKEKLKAKGIAWRPPEDLNPGIIID